MAKKKNKYVATPGAQFSPANAQAIGEALEELGEGISPDGLVDVAKTHPVLNELFEWDDTSAAHRYRLSQARHILGHIAVVVKMPDGGMKPVRAFHSLEVVDEGDETPSRNYIHINVVKREPELAEAVVLRAKAEVKAWRQRYNHLREYFEPVFKAIERV